MFNFTKKVEWPDLEVGEVFGFIGCVGIGCKVSHKRIMVLTTTDDAEVFGPVAGDVRDTTSIENCQLYRLDDKTQALFKT